MIVHTNSWTDYAALKKSPSSPVLSYYRSVVFHPEENIVLPGVLSRAYTFDGYLKPLFPASLCNFTACSISRDRTTMLTNCPEDAKCIIMWSLRNGTESIRTTRNDDVLSFAWSLDGRLLAISHCTGLICFVDVRDGFRTVAEYYFENDEVCGMNTFLRNCRSLFCCNQTDLIYKKFFRLNVDIAEHPSCTLDHLSASYLELKSPSVAGFLLGDPSLAVGFYFVLDTCELTVLRGSPEFCDLELLDIHELRRTLSGLKTSFEGFIPPVRSLPRTLAGVTMVPISRSRFISNVAFSLTGETVYVFGIGARNTVATAWDVSREEPVRQVGIFKYSLLEACMKEGVLLSTASGCLEMWNFELSNCIRRWPKLVQPMEITQTIPISEEWVALGSENKVIILNTTTSEIVSIPVDHGDFVTCNSKCQLLTWSSGSLQLLDGQTTLWETDLGLRTLFGTFSPSDRFVVVCAKAQEDDQGMYVLDALSGGILHTLCQGNDFSDCQFVSDEECVILSGVASKRSALLLFDVESGDLLSVIDLGKNSFCLAVCPCKRLLATDRTDSKLGFELIQVHLPRDKDSRENKR